MIAVCIPVSMRRKSLSGGLCARDSEAKATASAKAKPPTLMTCPPLFQVALGVKSFTAKHNTHWTVLPAFPVIATQGLLRVADYNWIDYYS
jgi:hypothetical protein